MITASQLRTLGSDGLAKLLQRRPEAATSEPESLAELAELLGTPATTFAAVRRLNTPALQVAEALAALGGSATAAEVSQLLGAPADEVGAVLRTLGELMLITTDPQPTLHPVVQQMWPRPLGLGVPAARVFANRTVDDLRQLAGACGITLRGTRKAEILDQMLGRFQDPIWVRALVAEAPQEIQDELRFAAHSGVSIEIKQYHFHYYGSYHYNQLAVEETTDVWGVRRGLLFLDYDEDGLQLIAEAALALRGPQYVAPFDPEPPAVPAPRQAGSRMFAPDDGIAAAGDFLRRVTILLDSAGHNPIALLKAGGVGARELKRLGKLLDCPADEVRLLLAITIAAGLWAVDDSVGAPTERYDTWLREPPAQRLAELLRVWWQLPQIPLATEGAWGSEGHVLLPNLRHRVLAMASPDGVADPAALAARIAWETPYAYGVEPTELPKVARASWRAAELLGAVAGGYVTPIGKALLTGAALEPALAALGDATPAVRLQADLTAVVSGTPTAELADLLDSAAAIESRGTASTWRFSPATVRAALDAGATPDELLAALASFATGGVPQALDYLIRDVARRHGAVRVQAASTCLCSADTALLAEIAADRRLRRLQLRSLAPTVLAGAAPLAETLAALREAGYAPLAEDASGTVQLERPAAARVALASVPQPRVARAAAPEFDAPALAKKLLAGPDEQELPFDGALARLREHLTQVSIVEARLLARAIDTHTQVRIGYVNRSGAYSERVISQIQLGGESLYAWCHLREDQRWFNLHQIREISQPH